jgi:methionyl-tRNA synthetase
VVKAATVDSAPFIPQTAEELWQTLNLPGKVSQSSWSEALNPIEAGHKINKPKPLFHKIEGDDAKLDEQLAEIRKKLPNQPK